MSLNLLIFRCLTLIFAANSLIEYYDDTQNIVLVDLELGNEGRNHSFVENYCQIKFYEGHLASITSLEERDKILNLWNKTGLGEFAINSYWIGLVRSNVSCNGCDFNTCRQPGYYKWLNGDEYSYTHWAANEPNACDTFGVVNGCIRARVTSNFHPWSDMPCTQEYNTFVCKFNNSLSPSNYPTYNPTKNPTNEPTINPSNEPSITPSMGPSTSPSVFPSDYPSNIPSNNPSINPTNNPSKYPTLVPSFNPSNVPSNIPSTVFSGNPSTIPSIVPTFLPTINPTQSPEQLTFIEPSKTPTNKSKQNSNGTISAVLLVLLVTIPIIITKTVIIFYQYYKLQKHEKCESHKKHLERISSNDIQLRTQLSPNIINAIQSSTLDNIKPKKHKDTIDSNNEQNEVTNNENNENIDDESIDEMFNPQNNQNEINGNSKPIGENNNDYQLSLRVASATIDEIPKPNLLSEGENIQMSRQSEGHKINQKSNNTTKL